MKQNDSAQAAVVKRKVAVLARDASGAPDLLIVDVQCLQQAYDLGEHYDVAERSAEVEGYQPLASFDETDPAWSKLAERDHKHAQALTMLLGTLRELGFGGDDQIDGGDAVEALGEVYETITTEILAGPFDLPFAYLVQNEEATAAAICRVLGVVLKAGSDDRWSWDYAGTSGRNFDSQGEAAIDAMRRILPSADWQQEVARGDTRVGYLEWALREAEARPGDPEATTEEGASHA